MKKIFLLQALLFVGLAVNSQPSNVRLMPVTTNSETALAFYGQARKYFDDVNLPRGLETFRKALKEDPDFFMANYQLALFCLLNQVKNDFDKYADAALNSKSALSDGEKLLKEALSKLSKGTSDVTDIGKKLLAIYPNDPESYNNLVSFQSIAGDTAAIVETLEKAIKVSPDSGPFYNQLGYAYLSLNKSDKAEAAFDRYIALEPGNPNVYDSKGDFYMFIKKYNNAYYSYMKAHSMDPDFSREKADMAKQLYEQTEGKQIDIISM